MIAVDLFCGAGGLSAGFVRAGFGIASAIDIDENAVETYKYNHDCSPVWGDISDVGQLNRIIENIRENGYNPDNIDVVIGGPPCKGFSQANVKTRGKNNHLNGLIRKFVEVVNELQPSAVVIENVPNILKMNNGEFKKAIENVFRDIGYNIDSKILKSEQYGVPQRRRRAFFIGVKNGSPPFPDPIYQTWEEVKNDMCSLDLIKVEEAIMDLPPLPEGGGGEELMEYNKKGKEPSKYVNQLRSEIDNGVVYNHETTVNREETYRRFKHIPQGGNWRDIPSRLMSNYTNRKRTHDHIYHRLKLEEPAKTIANFRKQMMVHPTQDRLLSIREAARLQSFPDDYRFVSDSKTAKQQMVGNAVPVQLSEAIGIALYNHLDVGK